LVFCTRSFQAFLSLVIWLQFLSFSFFKSFITSCPLVLTPVGFQTVFFLTSFVSSVLLGYPHRISLCAFIYLTVSSPFIATIANRYYFIFSILPCTELDQISSLIFVFQKLINYLCSVQTVSIFCLHRSLPTLSMSCRSSF
jgi:hypothetical protein